GKRLSLHVTGRDAAGAFVLKRTYRIDPADPSYASELAAVVSLGILEGRWKAVKGAGMGAERDAVTAGAGDRELLLAIEFRGMSEWQDISRKLAATPGVEELEVAGLSARGARGTLRYAEGAERVADAPAQQGPRLRKPGRTGGWARP